MTSSSDQRQPVRPGEWEDASVRLERECKSLRAQLATLTAENDRLRCWKETAITNAQLARDAHADLASAREQIAGLRSLKAGIVRVELANGLFGSATYAPELLCTDLERERDQARTQCERMQSVVEVARFADNCIDDDDPVSTHNNGPGSCLWDLHKSLAALDQQARQHT